MVVRSSEDSEGDDSSSVVARGVRSICILMHVFNLLGAARNLKGDFVSCRVEEVNVAIFVWEVLSDSGYG